MKKKSPSVVHSGLSLIIVIFIVLCLAVFSALSLVTARSDYVLAQQEARRSLSVQDAENQARRWAKDMDDALTQLFSSSENADDCLRALSDSDLLSEYYRAPEEASSAASDTRALGTLSADFSISESQQLSVELALWWPAEQRFYTVTKWLVENTGVWEGDQSIPVYVEDTEVS